MNENKLIIKFNNVFVMPSNFTGCCYVETFGATYWMKNGRIHREDGPAVIFDNDYSSGVNDSKTFDQYWLEGNYFVKEEYWNHHKVMKKKLDLILELQEGIEYNDH